MSTLQLIAFSSAYYPLYLNLALKTKDPLVRFQYFVVATLAYLWCYNSYAKPLNPILGETLNAHFEDGSQVYCE